MKRTLILCLVALGCLSATTASASATWPAACTSMLCVNAHLNNLDIRARAQSQKLAIANQTIRDLESRVYSLENSRNAVNSKFSCLTGKALWQQYTYDYYGNFFTYLDLSRNYGQGPNSGPYIALFDTCGIF